MLANENLITNTNVGGFVKVYNYGGYVAYFVVAYDLNGNHVIRQSPMFSVGQSQIIGVPSGAINVQFEALAAVYWSSWKIICMKNLPNNPAKCFSLTGTTWFPACNEIPCSTGGNGNTSNGCNCCCNCSCCNNTMC